MIAPEVRIQDHHLRQIQHAINYMIYRNAKSGQSNINNDRKISSCFITFSHLDKDNTNVCISNACIPANIKTAMRAIDK